MRLSRLLEARSGQQSKGGCRASRRGGASALRAQGGLSRGRSRAALRQELPPQRKHSSSEFVRGGELQPPATRVASVLQASGVRGDATVFRLNASVAGQSGSGSAFRRNTAEPVYRIEAAHNPEVAGSNPAPATRKALETGPFCLRAQTALQNFCPTFARGDARWPRNPAKSPLHLAARRGLGFGLRLRGSR
jgi:hypothetical protein